MIERREHVVSSLAILEQNSVEASMDGKSAMKKQIVIDKRNKQ